MNRRLIQSIVIGLSCVLVLGGRAGTQELPTLRITGSLVESQKNIFYGIRAGLFRKYGLNVEFVAASSGAAALASLAGGSVQIATTSVVPLLQAHLRGLPSDRWHRDSGTRATRRQTRCSCAPIPRSAPHATLPARRSPFSRSRISVGPRPPHGLIRTAATYTPSKRSSFPLAAVLPALVEGRIDAQARSQRIRSSSRGCRAGRCACSGRTSTRSPSTTKPEILVSAADYVTANHDLMSRFTHALHDAVAYTNSHPAETIDLVASFTGRSTGRSSHARTRTTSIPSTSNLGDLQPSHRYRVQVPAHRPPLSGGGALQQRPLARAELVAVARDEAAVAFERRRRFAPLAELAIGLARNGVAQHVVERQARAGSSP